MDCWCGDAVFGSIDFPQKFSVRGPFTVPGVHPVRGLKVRPLKWRKASQIFLRQNLSARGAFVTFAHGAGVTVVTVVGESGCHSGAMARAQSIATKPASSSGVHTPACWATVRIAPIHLMRDCAHEPIVGTRDMIEGRYGRNASNAGIISGGNNWGVCHDAHPRLCLANGA